MDYNNPDFEGQGPYSQIILRLKVAPNRQI